jgi:TrpR-related protein YerC/YecD
MDIMKNQKTEDLINAFLALDTAREARMFLRDLLTEKELLELGNRWLAVQMLDKIIPYTRIVQATGLSSTTIARISKWLQKGAGGYRLMLNRISKKHHITLSRLRKC